MVRSRIPVVLAITLLILGCTGTNVEGTEPSLPEASGVDPFHPAENGTTETTDRDADTSSVDEVDAPTTPAAGSAVEAGATVDPAPRDDDVPSTPSATPTPPVRSTSTTPTPPTPTVSTPTDAPTTPTAPAESDTTTAGSDPEVGDEPPADTADGAVPETPTSVAEPDAGGSTADEPSVDRPTETVDAPVTDVDTPNVDTPTVESPDEVPASDPSTAVETAVPDPTITNPDVPDPTVPDTIVDAPDVDPEGTPDVSALVPPDDSDSGAVDRSIPDPTVTDVGVAPASPTVPETVEDIVGPGGSAPPDVPEVPEITGSVSEAGDRVRADAPSSVASPGPIEPGGIVTGDAGVPVDAAEPVEPVDPDLTATVDDVVGLGDDRILPGSLPTRIAPIGAKGDESTAGSRRGAESVGAADLTRITDAVSRVDAGPIRSSGSGGGSVAGIDAERLAGRLAAVDPGSAVPSDGSVSSTDRTTLDDIVSDRSTGDGSPLGRDDVTAAVDRASAAADGDERDRATVASGGIGTDDLSDTGPGSGVDRAGERRAGSSPVAAGGAKPARDDAEPARAGTDGDGSRSDRPAASARSAPGLDEPAADHPPAGNDRPGVVSEPGAHGPEGGAGQSASDGSAARKGRSGTSIVAAISDGVRAADRRLPDDPTTRAAIGLSVLVAAGAAVRSVGLLGTSGPPTGASTARTAARTTLSAARTKWDRVRTHPLVPFPGYSRHDGSDPLENETRRELYEEIESSPGAYLAALAEATETSLSTVRYHLDVLQEEALVEAAKIRGKRRFFPAGFGEGDTAFVAALRDDATAELLDAVARHEPVTVSELSAHLDRAPSTVSYHLTRLHDDGLVERERTGESVATRLSEPLRCALGDEPTTVD